MTLGKVYECQDTKLYFRTLQNSVEGGGDPKIVYQDRAAIYIVTK